MAQHIPCRHACRHARAVNLTAVEVFRDTDQDLMPALRLHFPADNKHRHQSDGSEHHAVELWGGSHAEVGRQRRECEDYACALLSHKRTRGDVLASHTHTHTHFTHTHTRAPCTLTVLARVRLSFVFVASMNAA